MGGRFRKGRWPALVVATGLSLAACAAPNAATSAVSASSAQAGNAGTTARIPISEPAVAPQESLVQTPAGTVADTTVPALRACTKGNVPTRVPGTLTIATGSPAQPPWFVGNPAGGQGLESAVAAAIADGLGYPGDRVRWTQIDRRDATAGVRTDFDLDLDQFTAPDAGTTTADYSTGYYAVTDSVLIPAGHPTPSSVHDVEKLTLGAGPGATRDAAGGAPRRFDTDEAAIAAAATKAVEGVILPTPAALEVARGNPAMVVAGQLPSDPSVQPDQFKALLPKGSALTGCVSATIDRLRAEGALDELAATWVAPSAPPLR